MLTGITHVTVLVADVDEVLEWDTGVFGLEARDDEEFAPGVRWVTVAPPRGETELVLQEPDFHGNEAGAAMRDHVGAGTITVLGTDDCRGTVEELADRGVPVTRGPGEVPWGVYVIVEDLYGNPFNLVEAR